MGVESHYVEANGKTVGENTGELNFVVASTDIDSDVIMGAPGLGGTFEVITGFETSITLPREMPLYAVAGYTVTSPAGGACVVGVRIAIVGEDPGTSLRVDLRSNDNPQSGTCRQLITLPPGTYTVQVEFRKVSGGGTVTFNRGTLFVQGQGLA